MWRPEPALLRLLVFLGALVATVTLLLELREVVLPLLLGLAIAYVLDPAVTALGRRGVSRSVGASILFAAVVLALVVGLWVIVPAIGDQLAQARQRLPEYAARLRTELVPWLASLHERYPKLYDQVEDQLREGARTQLPRVAQEVGLWLAGVFGSVAHLLLFLLNLIFVPVFAFYLLVDFPKLRANIRDLVPVPYRKTVTARVGEVDKVVSAFLRGQLTIALILAAINAVGLLIIGVPLGIAIGIAAGLANMVPYMSLVVGLVPSLLLCWAEYQSIPRLVAVGAVFGLGHLLEGTFLSPRILGRSVDLHPVWILLAIIVGGSFFGIFGMVLAVPVAASIQVFVRHWIVAYKASRIYRGDDDLQPPEVAAA